MSSNSDFSRQSHNRDGEHYHFVNESHGKELAAQHSEMDDTSGPLSTLVYSQNTLHNLEQIEQH